MMHVPMIIVILLADVNIPPLAAMIMMLVPMMVVMRKKVVHILP
jgi:hypothetical protein